MKALVDFLVSWNGCVFYVYQAKPMFGHSMVDSEAGFLRSGCEVCSVHTGCKPASTIDLRD